MSSWYVASVMPPVVTHDPINGHRYRGWRPCIEWCVKHFGEQRYHLDNSRGGERWRFVSEGVFEFKNEQDRTMFLLRWS
jgi:hypothetical protein